MTLEIAKILTVSTAHITPASADFLETNSRTDEYGYFLSTYHETADYFPEDVIEVLRFAKENDCEYVNIDRDGPTVPGLKVYDW